MTEKQDMRGKVSRLTDRNLIELALHLGTYNRRDIESRIMFKHSVDEIKQAFKDMGFSRIYGW